MHLFEQKGLVRVHGTFEWQVKNIMGDQLQYWNIFSSPMIDSSELCVPCFVRQTAGEAGQRSSDPGCTD